MGVAGTLTISKNGQPRISVGGDGEMMVRKTMAFDGASTQSHMDSPFNRITGAVITPLAGVPDDMRIADAPIDGVVMREADGTIQIARTDTTSSSPFFIQLIGLA